LVALFAVFAGCKGTADLPEETTVVSRRLPSSPLGLSPVYTESISIEGMIEQIQVRDFEPPVGFPVGFGTVVPADMTVDFVSTGQGDAVRFEAAFAGIRRPDAALSFTVLPQGTDTADARRRVTAVAAGLGARPRELADGDWAMERYGLQGDTVGFLALGEHRAHWFYFLAQYPPEFGDGMGPRIDLILRRWRWADHNTGLSVE
jgi:hypothetical protein